MDNLLQKIQELQTEFLLAFNSLEIDKLKAKEEKLREQMASPDFWDEQAEAVKVSTEAERLTSEIEPWKKLKKDLSESVDILDLAELDEDNADKALIKDIEDKYKQMKDSFNVLKLNSLLSGKYDKNNAIISIHSGVGGVDAQDFALMLERMYLRFAQREGYKAKVLDRSYGNEAGIKSSVIEVSGLYAYGYLKSENGVHRLLRNSPFNSDNLRQTSFALVELIPEIKDEGEIEIKDEDIRIDVYRSSGPGGQSVNTTDSAVRVVHLESGITVSCQSERSQHQNKENALKILKARLIQLKLQEQEEKMDKLKGNVKQADWGRQIRSYFLYGNKLVKDHRTNLEEKNVEAVLDGDIKAFMEAYLSHKDK